MSVCLRVTDSERIQMRGQTPQNDVYRACVCVRVCIYREEKCVKEHVDISRVHRAANEAWKGISPRDPEPMFPEAESDSNSSTFVARGTSPSFPPSPSGTPAAVGGSNGWGANQSRGGKGEGASGGSRFGGAAAGLPPAGAAPAGNAGSSTFASEERDSEEDTNTSGSLHHMCPPPPSTPAAAGGRVGQGGDGGSGGMGEGISAGSRVGGAAAGLPSAGAASEGNAKKAGNDSASASKRQLPEEVLGTNTNRSIYVCIFSNSCCLFLARCTPIL